MNNDLVAQALDPRTNLINLLQLEIAEMQQARNEIAALIKVKEKDLEAHITAIEVAQRTIAGLNEQLERSQALALSEAV